MMRSSITLSFVGLLVDWMMNASTPRTFSPISTKLSPSLKRVMRHLPTGVSRYPAIASASSTLAFPEKRHTFLNTYADLLRRAIPRRRCAPRPPPSVARNSLSTDAQRTRCTRIAGWARGGRHCGRSAVTGVERAHALRGLRERLRGGIVRLRRRGRSEVVGRRGRLRGRRPPRRRGVVARQGGLHDRRDAEKSRHPHGAPDVAGEPRATRDRLRREAASELVVRREAERVLLDRAPLGQPR